MNRFKTTLTVLFFMSNINSFGGGVMQGVMNYPAWKMISPTDFPAFHQSVSGRVILFFVPIFFASVPIGILMIWFGHPAISRKLLVAMALINSLIFIVTITMAIPIQSRMDGGKAGELIDQLIFYDRYFRIYPGVVGMVLNFVMLDQIARKAMP